MNMWKYGVVTSLMVATIDLFAQPVTYSNPFHEYGTAVNESCPVAAGICAAIATINSFVFLQNHYPGIYGDHLVAPGEDQTEARRWADLGWQVGSNPARTGYYRRTGDPYKNFWETKIEWIEDRAPGLTVYDAQIYSPGDSADTWLRGQDVEFQYPDWQFLAGEIKDGEDVELIIEPLDGTGGAHAITLTSVTFDSALGGCETVGNCSILFQDPNHVSSPFFAEVTLTGGRLVFNDPFTFKEPVYIVAAFAESPIPEPSTAVLLLVSGPVAIWLLRRKRHPSTERRSSGDEVVSEPTVGPAHAI
jgi:hypothetical protein